MIQIKMFGIKIMFEIIFVEDQNGKEKLILQFSRMENLLLNKMLELELRALLQEIYNIKILMFMQEKNMEKEKLKVMIYFLKIMILMEN